MYTYKIKKVVKIIDGDTIRADIDLGFGITSTKTIRLLDIDTPELNSKDEEEREKAKAAKKYVMTWLYINRDHLIIQTKKDKSGKYGRFLGLIIGKRGKCLNNDLIQEGLAVEYN